MNRAQLINTLARENSLTKAQAKEAVDLFFDEMAQALTEGERVEVRGLCSIFVKKYRAYTGRNPKTGEHAQVGPKKLPFFKAGKELKERVDR